MAYWYRSETSQSFLGREYFYFVDAANASMSLVGPTIYTMLMVAPFWVAEHSCNPSRANLSHDLPKKIELYILTTAIGLQYGKRGLWYVLRQCRCLDEDYDDSRFRKGTYYFNEVTDAVESLAFRYNVMKQINPEFPWWLCAGVGLRFFWPIFCLLTGWERGYKSHHDEKDPEQPCRRYFKILCEALYNGESLSSAFITIATLIYNLVVGPFADTNSVFQRSLQAWIIGVSWVVGEVLGYTSVRNEKNWLRVRFTEGATNNLYYWFSSVTSLVACLQISWMEGNAFLYKGLPLCAVVFFMTAACFSIHAGDDTQHTLDEQRILISNDKVVTPPSAYTALG